MNGSIALRRLLPILLLPAAALGLLLMLPGGDAARAEGDATRDLTGSSFTITPSIYITGDTVLTDTVADAIARLQPDVVVAPAGCANLGFGDDILFPLPELLELPRMAPARVVFNHMEALDHCPTTRKGLRDRLTEAGLERKAHLPEDGELVEI